MRNIDKFTSIMEKFQVTTFLEACFNGDLDAVTQIYKDSSIYYSHIGNAAYHAVDQGHLEILKFLFEQSPETIKKDSNLIIHAAREGRLEVLTFLHQNGGDIHFNKDESLVEAARSGHLPIIQYFAKNGVDIAGNNSLALRKAAKYNRLEVVKYLVENGSVIHNEAVKVSAKSGYIEQLDYLLSQGGNKEVAEKHGNAKVQAWLLHIELDNHNKQTIKKSKI